MHHDDVIKWKHFPRYWPFVRGFHRSPVNSPRKGQWHGALMFSLICARINGYVNNHKTFDLRRHRDHYDVTVMLQDFSPRPPPMWWYDCVPWKMAIGRAQQCTLNFRAYLLFLLPNNASRPSYNQSRGARVICSYTCLCCNIFQLKVV